VPAAVDEGPGCALRRYCECHDVFLFVFGAYAKASLRSGSTDRQANRSVQRGAMLDRKP
jgi:hypothetical protein